MEAGYPLLDHLHDSRRVHRDLGALEAFWVVDVGLVRVRVVARYGVSLSTQSTDTKEDEMNARVVPDREVPHAQRHRRPVVIVREALRVEDLDNSGDGGHRHHDEMLHRPVSTAHIRVNVQ